MATDLRGCPVSTRFDDAVAHVEQACWRLSSFYGDPIADLQAASDVDPGWMLPHVIAGGFLLSLTEQRLLSDAAAALERAQALAGEGNERERAHLAAAQACLQGRWHEACARWDDILLQHPRDIVALQLAHLFDFYRGDARNLRARVARALPDWTPDDPLYPYVLGMYAFGLEECNLYPQAEAMGRQAVDGDTRVPWAIHAVAHVMEMQGRHDEGREWLEQRRPGWAEDDNGLAVHNWWHLALFHLESLDSAAALRIHDEHIAGAAAEEFALMRLDASALLWRLRLLDVDVGARWKPLARAWQKDAGARGHYAFNDVHALLALIGDGQIAAARTLVREASRRAESDTGVNRDMAREVGLPLMHGLMAHAQARDDEAIEHLYAVRAHAHRFGGSHAQRDLIDQTLLASAARAGRREVARALLNERALSKPVTPLTRRWATHCMQSTQ